MEDLNIKSMLKKKEKDVSIDSNKKKYEAKPENIHDASWGSFAAILLYKAENAGKEIIKVNPKNTSKMCSGCCNIKDNLELKDRTYNCDACGISIDRDYNATINIRRLGTNLAAAKKKTASEAPEL